jgi:hypothetical protein
MKKPFVTTLSFICALAMSQSCLVMAQETATAEKQATDLPAGKDILARHVEAVGGAEKIKAAKTTVMKGEYQMPAAGINAPMTITFALPQKAFFEIEIPGMGKILKGTNGDVAWENSVMSGPRILEGSEKSQFMREADSLSDLIPDKYFKSIECVGRGEVNGKDCYEVQFTTNEDEVETRHISSEDYLLVKQEQTQKTPMGDVPVESIPSDYREVDGLQVPHSIEVNVMGQQQIMKVDSVAFNTEVPDSTFDLPEEIKSLLEAAEAEAQ